MNGWKRGTALLILPRSSSDGTLRGGVDSLTGGWATETAPEGTGVGVGVLTGGAEETGGLAG